MKARKLPMMIKPPSKEHFLCMAEACFRQTFKRAELFGWDYLFMWAMYDHWLEQYWDQP
jgi:hypothetical protein